MINTEFLYKYLKITTNAQVEYCFGVSYYEFILIAFKKNSFTVPEDRLFSKKY